MKNKEVLLLLIAFIITSGILGVLGFIFLSFSQKNLYSKHESVHEDESKKQSDSQSKLDGDSNEKPTQVRDSTYGDEPNKQSENQSKSDEGNTNELSQLREFLKNRDFKSADDITDIILKRAIISSQISDINCNLINEIDGLWQDYSDDKFGYSEQLKIWNQSQTNAKENSSVDVYKKYQQAVGWIKDNKVLYQPDLEYDLNAPIAHLPWSSWQVQGQYRSGFGDFMKKVRICQSQ